MKASRILSQVVAIVIAATVGFHHQATCAPQSLGCASPQLDVIIGKIAAVRSETSSGSNSKPERCIAFVEQANEQPDLVAALGKAKDDPSEMLAKIIKVLALRASCTGPQMGGLAWLQEFTEDCQLLIEVAAEEVDKETSAGDGDSEEKKLQEVVSEQAGTIRRLQDELGKISRETQNKKSCPVSPGSVYEAEIVRSARDGKLGVGIGTALGAAFVKRIFAGSPAAAAGLRFGDQVILINGRPATNHEVRELATNRSANSLKLLVKKSPFEQSVVLRRASDKESWGFRVHNGVVTSLSPGDSPATRAGLMQRLKIITINNESVIGSTCEQCEKLVAKSGNELSLKLLPVTLYEQLILDMNVDDQRWENNKILKANGS